MWLIGKHPPGSGSAGHSWPPPRTLPSGRTITLPQSSGGCRPSSAAPLRQLAPKKTTRPPDLISCQRHVEGQVRDRPPRKLLLVAAVRCGRREGVGPQDLNNTKHLASRAPDRPAHISFFVGRPGEPAGCGLTQGRSRSGSARPVQESRSPFGVNWGYGFLAFVLPEPNDKPTRKLAEPPPPPPRPKA